MNRSRSLATDEDTDVVWRATIDSTMNAAGSPIVALETCLDQTAKDNRGALSSLSVPIGGEKRGKTGVDKETCTDRNRLSIRLLRWHHVPRR